MKILSLTITSLAVLSLSACSTLKPEDALLGGISADKIAAAPLSAEEAAAAGTSGVTSSASLLAESQIRGSFNNPTCGQFNMNALAFSAKPETPSFGTGLLKTIILGTLGGVASGGVASLGIGSAFVEAAAVGTANQVVFNGAQPAVDKVVPDGTVGSTEKSIALKEAANRVGCPNPTWAQRLSPKDANRLLKKFDVERKAAKKLAKAVGG